MAPSGTGGSPACSTHPYDSLSHPLQPTPAPGPASPSPTCTACDKDGVSRCTLTRVLPTSLLIGATKQDLCQCKSLGKSKHFFPQWCLFPTEIFKTPLEAGFHTLHQKERARTCQKSPFLVHVGSGFFRDGDGLETPNILMWAWAPRALCVSPWDRLPGLGEALPL